jgi:hypothetical protein
VGSNFHVLERFHAIDLGCIAARQKTTSGRGACAFSSSFFIFRLEISRRDLNLDVFHNH